MLPALRAFHEKKAVEVCVLEMDLSGGAFTDYILLASGTNSRQVQAIADGVEFNLKQEGSYVNHVEGYKQAEWIMLDYVDFVVCVFSERARRYYDLERLWKSAKRMTMDEAIAAATPKVKVKAKKRVVAKVTVKAGLKASAKAVSKVAAKPGRAKSTAKKTIGGVKAKVPAKVKAKAKAKPAAKPTPRARGTKSKAKA